MMDRRVDLHIHSTASDGCWTPGELVQQVERVGIELFAVTDHDNISSLREARELACNRGLAFLPGVEISSKLDGTLIHVLAYGFDPADLQLAEFLQRNEQILHDYDDQSIAMLLDAGYKIDMHAYHRYTWDRRRGGWKALNFLIDMGLCRDVHSFFGELFVGDLTLHFPEFPSIEEVIQISRQANAVPIWAHPGGSLRGVGMPEADRAFTHMVEAGLAGIECYSHHHDAEWTHRCLAWAERYDLLVTGGSDSHGGFAGRELGRPEIYLSDLRLGELTGWMDAS